MLINICDMKEYIRKELEWIDDRSTVHDLFCTVLEHGGTTYLSFRMAEIRRRERQLRIFKHHRK